MDDRLKKLIRRRDAKLGWICLILLAIAFVVCNRFAFSMMDSSTGRFPQVLWMTTAVGCIASQVMLLVLWTTLASRPFFNRMQFLFSAALTLLSAWMLGYLSVFSTEIGLNLANREEFYFVPWIAPLFLVAALPFIAIRFFGWRVIGSVYESDAPTRNSVSTAGLMITTGIVAASLAAIETPTLAGRMSQGDTWMAFGIVSAFVIGASLLICLPATLILLSRYRSFFIWSFGTFVIVVIVASLAGVTMAQYSFFGFRARTAFMPAAIIGSGIFFFTMGVATLRLFGYRLMTAVIGQEKYGTKLDAAMASGINDSQ